MLQSAWQRGEERLNDLALRNPNEKIHTFCTLCDGESGITDHTDPLRAHAMKLDGGSQAHFRD